MCRDDTETGRTSLRQEIWAFAKRTYRVEPDRPFPNAPGCSVLRHGDNRKIFALFMPVGRDRLGLPGKERVEVMNVKCSTALSGALRQQEGILPPYHMQGDGWVSVLLDGTVPLEDILPLVELSFQLTAERKRRRGRADWLVPADPRLYDLPGAIAASPDGSFLWKQSSAVQVGDGVYIYVTAPVSGICYRCRAVEVDIPYRFAEGKIRMDRVMRLRLLQRYEEPVSLARLRAHGVSTVRGPRYMPESLLDELDPGRAPGGREETEP